MYYPSNEKYEKDVYAHHVAAYGTPDQFGYRDFVPMFQAERFNSNAWAELFKEAGARFVMPVAEHHDGFQMYDSALSDWCAKKMGPKRDCLLELKTAIEKKTWYLQPLLTGQSTIGLWDRAGK